MSKSPCFALRGGQAVASECVLIAVVLSACGGSPEKISDKIFFQPVRESCPNRLSEDFFFPGRGVIGTDGSLGSIYSRILKTANEPSLSCGTPTEPEAYRLTELQPLRPSPLVVRVVRQKDVVRVFAIRLSGGGADDAPFVTSKRTERIAAETDWLALKAALTGMDFWNVPTNTTATDFVNDAEDWLIEGREGDKYHAVHLNRQPAMLHCVKEFYRVSVEVMP